MYTQYGDSISANSQIHEFTLTRKIGHRVQMYESMANNRAKCLAISQMIRAKSYNSCLIFVSKRVFYYYVVPCLIFFFLLFLTYTFVWAQKCPCFRAKLGARTRAKLSSLSSLLSSTAAKMLTSLALSPLLYLLCHCFLF